MTKFARIEPTPIHSPGPDHSGTLRRTSLNCVETLDSVLGWGETVVFKPLGVAVQGEIVARMSWLPDRPTDPIEASRRGIEAQEDALRRPAS